MAPFFSLELTGIMFCLTLTHADRQFRGNGPIINGLPDRPARRIVPSSSLEPSIQITLPRGS